MKDFWSIDHNFVIPGTWPIPTTPTILIGSLPSPLEPTEKKKKIKNTIKCPITFFRPIFFRYSKSCRLQRMSQENIPFI